MKGIRINDDGDIMINLRRQKLNKEKDGEIIVAGVVIGNVDMDIAERIIRAWQGEFKEVPLLGGNIDKFYKGTDAPFLKGHIYEQLISEDINVSSVEITEQGVEIELDD